jgi:hypothetical protein
VQINEKIEKKILTNNGNDVVLFMAYNRQIIILHCGIPFRFLYSQINYNIYRKKNKLIMH